MRRHRTAKQDVAFSLFPFLAVLICTMGALIVLLIVVVRQAKDHTDDLTVVDVEPVVAVVGEEPAIEPEPLPQQPEEPAGPTREELELERETQLWRIEEFEKVRAKTLEDLKRHKLQLSHLEDHTRELVEKIRRLQEEAKAIEESQAADDKASAEKQRELDDLRERIDRAENELEEAKKDAKERPKSYAIVPYDGRSGTSRRPIFVECRQDQVILQPEGIVLSAADFRGPMGPGNPLAAALRAIREYRAANSADDMNEEPYPLIVVRPGGAEAYAAARDAMSSWDSEFGYELVGEDIELEYPTPDPYLAEILGETIATARRRRQLIALAAPSRYGRDGIYGVRASSNGGGFVTEEGISAGVVERGGVEDGFDSGGFDATENSRRGGVAPGIGGETATGYPSGGEYAETPPTGSHERGLATTRPSGQPGETRFGQGGPYTPNGPGEYTGTGQGEFQQPPDGDFTATGRDGFSQNSGAQANPLRGGQGQGGQFAQGSDSATRNQGGNDSQFPRGDSVAHGEIQGEARAEDASGASSSGTSENARRAPAGAPAGVDRGGYIGGSHSMGGASGQTTPSLASSRGRDWALPNKSLGSTGVTRPIRVQVFSGRLVVSPERGSGASAKEIPVPGSMKESIDGFIDTVWKRIDRWGMAGPSMYWKPVLNVEVYPGGETRFQELRHLLQGSGIEIERSNR
jgi:hypothetical protein